MAWKAFRRDFAGKIKENKRSDRIQMQKIAHGGAVDAPSPQPEVAPAPAAGIDEPRWAVDPETGTIFDSVTGREASDEEASTLGMGEGLPEMDPVSLINFKVPVTAATATPIAAAPPTVKADSFRARTPAQLIADIQSGKRKPKYTDPNHWGL
jgi:hypothetical protein